ncbi:MAG: alkyl hydroperoxide reductase [Candidatus Margulisbacteria bacterium GWF2_35_9]|nr:MAG: alkyl hydroperoxide reductase [Candidatus Margulisbacteria bacterium GWF2_35_9]
MLTTGDKAIDFQLDGIDENGNENVFKLEEMLLFGKDVILYFYPKDNTPGCTAEACDFRDNMSRLTSKYTVIGVSKDSVKSHHKFQTDHNLNFVLVSDPDCAVMKKYDVWGLKKMYGKESMGVIRSTFVINQEGVLTHVWRNVKATGHVDKIIEELAKD